MPKTKKEKLEIINQYLNALALQPYYLSMHLYTPRNEEQINEIVEHPDTYLIKYASIIDDAIQASNDTDTLKREFQINDENISVARLLFDYRYLNKTGKEREEIKEKNLQIAKDLQNPAKRKAMLEDKLESLLKMDISQITTGSLTQRMGYMSDCLNDTLSLYQINDLVEAYKSVENPNQELQSLIQERKEDFDFYAGTVKMTNLLRQDYYPLLKDVNPYIYEVIRKKPQENPQTDEDRIRSDFQKVSKDLFLPVYDLKDLNRDRKKYEFLSKYGFLDGGEYGISFYPVNKDGEKISLKKAVERMDNNRIVTFKERSQDYVDYFNTGLQWDKPDNVDSGGEITFKGYEIIKNDIKYLTSNEYNRARESIENFARRLNATGVTVKDSEEFKILRNMCSELTVKLPKDKKEFRSKMNDLNKAADNYYQAKIGQSKNSRRSERLNIVNEIRNVTHTYALEIEKERLSDFFQDKNMEYRSTGGDNFMRNQSHRLLVKRVVNGKPEFHPIGNNEDALENLMLLHPEQLTEMIAKGELYLYSSGAKYPSQVILKDGRYTLSEMKMNDNLTPLPERPSGWKRTFSFLSSRWQDQENTYQNALKQRNEEQQILDAAEKKVPERNERILTIEKQIALVNIRKKELQLIVNKHRLHEETMKRLDDTYGPTFKVNKSMVEGKILNPEKYNAQNFNVPKTTPFNKRDAAILVYAACANKKNLDLSPENAPDNAKSMHDRHYNMMQGSLYGLRSNTLADDPRYIPIAKGARQQVADVLAHYDPSNPKPVISILCEGLKLNNAVGLSLPGENLSYQNAECLHFSGDILGVLNKIPNGLELAKKEGLLQQKDIDVANAFNNIAEIAFKSREAQVTLAQSEVKEIQGLEPGLTDLEKTECCRAVLNYQILSSMMNKAYADSESKTNTLLNKVGKDMTKLSKEKITAEVNGNMNLAKKKQKEFDEAFLKAASLSNETQIDPQGALIKQMSNPDAQKTFEKKFEKSRIAEEISRLSLKEINNLCKNSSGMVVRYKNPLRKLLNNGPTVNSKSKDIIKKKNVTIQKEPVIPKTIA